MKAAFAGSMVAVAIPAGVALLTVAFLVGRVDAQALRDLSLAWTCLAFFGNFDFGAGRVIGHASSTAKPGSAEAVTLKYAGALLQLAIGIGTCLLGILGLLLFVDHDLLRQHAVAIVLFALAIPLTTCFSGFRYRWEAHGQFHRSSLSSTLLNSSSYLVPALIVLLGMMPNLAAAAIAARVLLIVVLVWQFDPVHVREFSAIAPLMRQRMRGMVRLGAWNSLYSGLTLATNYVDRGIVAAYFSSAVGAAYNLSCDMAQRAGIFPAVAIRVVAPNLDRLAAEGRRDQFLLRTYVMAAAFCFLCVAFEFAIPWLVSVWLRGALGETPVLVFRYWLLVVALCGYNYLLVNAISSSGDFRTTALVQAWLFLPFVLPLVYFGIRLDLHSLVVMLAARAIVETTVLHVAFWRKRTLADGLWPTLLLLAGVAITTYTAYFFYSPG